jgi:hypothetical protein
MEYLAWTAIIFISFGYTYQAWRVFVTNETLGLSLRSYISLAMGFSILAYVSMYEATMKFTFKQLICLLPCLYIIYKVLVNKYIKPVKILLIDDDEDFYNIFNLFLGKSLKKKFCLNYASNPESGLDKLHVEDYDLIIVDFNFNSELNGLDILNIIYEKKPTQRCLLVTSKLKTLLGDNLLDLERPGLNFLAKPFSPQKISDLVAANI